MRDLIAALALTGHEAEAHEALQRYLALPPSGLRTIAAWKAYRAQVTNEHTDPRYLDYWDRANRGPAQGGDAGGVSVELRRRGLPYFSIASPDRGQLFAAVDKRGSRQEHARVEADRGKEKLPLRAVRRTPRRSPPKVNLRPAVGSLGSADSRHLSTSRVDPNGAWEAGNAAKPLASRRFTVLRTSPPPMSARPLPRGRPVDHP